MTKPPSQLTIGQASKVLKVSRARLIQLEEEGRLVPVGRGPRKVRMYDADQVVAFREQRIEAKLQTTTRIVEPTLEFAAIRGAVVADLALIVHKAAECSDPQAWIAAAKCAAVIVDATTPSVTVTKSIEATKKEGAAATAAQIAALLAPGGDDEVAPEYSRADAEGVA